MHKLRLMSGISLIRILHYSLILRASCQGSGFCHLRLELQADRHAHLAQHLHFYGGLNSGLHSLLSMEAPSTPAFCLFPLSLVQSFPVRTIHNCPCSLLHYKIQGHSHCSTAQYVASTAWLASQAGSHLLG